MATFRYDGEDERILPSVRVIVTQGDTFEAPDDFTAPDCVAVGSSSKKPPAPAVAPKSTEPTPSTSDKIAGE